MRLFHFSDDPDVAIFQPRPVRVPAERRAGQEWLNGPLVWAIDEWHQPMYLFPRECTRILLWRTPQTTEEDRARWFGQTSSRMIAHIERSWLERLKAATIYRYEFEDTAFENLDDAGMSVSRAPVSPRSMTRLDDLPGELQAQDVELRVLVSLLPLRAVWSSSLHASGIRLRNVEGWGGPGWLQSRGMQALPQKPKAGFPALALPKLGRVRPGHNLLWARLIGHFAAAVTQYLAIVAPPRRRKVTPAARTLTQTAPHS